MCNYSRSAKACPAMPRVLTFASLFSRDPKGSAGAARAPLPGAAKRRGIVLESFRADTRLNPGRSPAIGSLPTRLVAAIALADRQCQPDFPCKSELSFRDGHLTRSA